MYIVFFFNDTATTEIYTLSLHDALPISDELYNLAAQSFVAVSFEQPLYTAEIDALGPARLLEAVRHAGRGGPRFYQASDRKSTRLNSSHANISYAVFCLKKKIKSSIHIT